MTESDKVAEAFVKENGYLWDLWKIEYKDGVDHFREDMLTAIGEYLHGSTHVSTDTLEVIYREACRIYPYSKWVKNPTPPLNKEALDWIQGHAHKSEQKCDHERIKRELRELGGMIAFTYCFVCRKRVAHKGRRIDPERCVTKQTWSCRRCEYSEIKSIPYFSLIGPTPYCPGCGTDYALIAEVEQVVYQKRR